MLGSFRENRNFSAKPRLVRNVSSESCYSPVATPFQEKPFPIRGRLSRPPRRASGVSGFSQGARARAHAPTRSRDPAAVCRSILDRVAAVRKFALSRRKLIHRARIPLVISGESSYKSSSSSFHDGSIFIRDHPAFPTCSQLVSIRENRTHDLSRGRKDLTLFLVVVGVLFLSFLFLLRQGDVRRCVVCLVRRLFENTSALGKHLFSRFTCALITPRDALPVNFPRQSFQTLVRHWFAEDRRIFLFRTFGSLPCEGSASLGPLATSMAAILKIFKISKFHGTFVIFTSLGYFEVTSLFALFRRRFVYFSIFQGFPLNFRNFLGFFHDHTATIFQNYCTKLTVVSIDCSLTINCPPQSSKTKATLRSLNRQSKFQS